MKGKKGIIVASILIIFLISGSVAAKALFTGDDEILLDKVMAAFYVGTSHINENGRGTAVFLTEGGELQQINEENVAWASISYGDDQVVLHNREDVNFLQADGTQRKVAATDDCSVYLSYQGASGFLEETGMYYGLFNGGFVDVDESMGDYASTLRWGSVEEQTVRCEYVPHFIVAEGADDESIYLFSTKMIDGGFGELGLHKYTPSKDGMSIQEREVRSDSFELSFLKVLADDQHLYVLYMETEDVESDRLLKFMKLDKGSLTLLDDVTIDTYRAEEDPTFFPFNPEAGFVKDEQFYFVTGYGEVKVLDTNSFELSQLFTFDNYVPSEYLQDEVVHFKDDQLYFFRKVDNDHLLETYTLEGEKIDSLEIEGLTKILNKGSNSRFIYDFKLFH